MNQRTGFYECPNGHVVDGYGYHYAVVKNDEGVYEKVEYGPFCSMCYGEFMVKNLPLVKKIGEP